ncbi:hypothetical protein IWW33_004769 [Pseudomonas sp. BG2dil]|nr:hypothetical protein [Pseudomonas sp. M2]
MTSRSDFKTAQIAQLFQLEREVATGYKKACDMLEVEEVALALRFLLELDALATKHDFSPREIINLLKRNSSVVAAEK